MQRVRQEHVWVYRLIGYGNGETYSTVEFASLDEVLKVLRSINPDFGKDLLSVKGDGTGSSIILAESAELDDAQLNVLGLIKR